MPLLYCCTGAILSDSVFSAHCSPIADAAILSSSGAQCDHVKHVASQMPYALFSGFVAVVGFLLIGVTGNLGDQLCCAGIVDYINCSGFKREIILEEKT